MKKYFLIVACIALLLGACKPTELNYRLAYETALQREREGLDDDVLEAMKREQLPPLVRVAGDSVRIRRLPISWYYTPQMVDSGRRIDPEPYNVAVAVYKMPANASAHAEALAEDGFHAVVMKHGSEAFYVMAGCVESLDSAAHLSSRLLRERPGQFVGLSCPVAIQPVR